MVTSMDSSTNIFWGLVVKSGKRYETEVQEPFRITKACLEPASGANEVSSVYVECDNNEEFIIANLNSNNLNVTIDLSFNEGEKICFKIDGPGTVHLTGNLLDDPPTSDTYGMEDSDSQSDNEESMMGNSDAIKEMSSKEAKKKALKRKKVEAVDGKAKKAKVINVDTTIDTTLGDLDDTDNFAEENSSESDDDTDSDSDMEENTTVGDTTNNINTTAADSEEEDSNDSSEDSNNKEEDGSKKLEEGIENKGSSIEAEAPNSKDCKLSIETSNDKIKQLDSSQTDKETKEKPGSKTQMGDGPNEDSSNDDVKEEMDLSKKFVEDCNGEKSKSSDNSAIKTSKSKSKSPADKPEIKGKKQEPKQKELVILDESEDSSSVESEDDEKEEAPKKVDVTKGEISNEPKVEIRDSLMPLKPKGSDDNCAINTIKSESKPPVDKTLASQVDNQATKTLKPEMKYTKLDPKLKELVHVDESEESSDNSSDEKSEDDVNEKGKASEKVVGTKREMSNEPKRENGSLTPKNNKDSLKLKSNKTDIVTPKSTVEQSSTPKLSSGKSAKKTLKQGLDKVHNISDNKEKEISKNVKELKKENSVDVNVKINKSAIDTLKSPGKTSKSIEKKSKVSSQPSEPSSNEPCTEQQSKTSNKDSPKPKKSQTPGKTPKRTLKGGIQVEDLEEGSGAECKPGNIVGMYYEGRLKANDKKFDSREAGKPFKFKLGSGDVIKGWDVGVLGMKVGGKRRLTIPPKLGYGAVGSPPAVPPHATLVFDVECKFVK